MTAQESRAMFEARMKQSPAYKPELMKWTDGRYDFDIMESVYHGFILGMESTQPVARTPLSDDDVGLWIVRTLGAASKQGKYSAIRNCVPLGAELVPFFLEFARDHGITQEKL